MKPSEYEYPDGEDLLEMRVSAGLTRKEVADAIGLGGSSLYRIERTDKGHRVDAVGRLLSYYQYLVEMEGVSMDPSPFTFDVATGDELMEMRERVGLSRKELAQESGVAESMIKEIEIRHGRYPEKSTYQKLMNAMREFEGV